MLATDYADAMVPASGGLIALARRYASATSDVSTIRTLCRNSYGRAPADSIIRKLIEERQNARPPYVGKTWDEPINPADEKAEDDKANARMRVALGLDWPCGHRKTPETTHTIAGEGQCKVCRRRRWNAGFAKAVKKRAFIMRAPKDGLSLDDIIRGISIYLGVSSEVILSNSRTAKANHARVIAYKILRDRGHSFPDIGRVFSGRDQSSVRHTLKNWDMITARNPKIKACYDFVMRMR